MEHRYANGQKPYALYSDEEKLKAKARSKLKMRIRRGQMVKPDQCSECSSDKHIEGHHDDYSKPYDVTWLCRACHKALHVRLRKEGWEWTGLPKSPQTQIEKPLTHEEQANRLRELIMRRRNL